MTKFNFKEKEFLWNSEKLSWTEALKTCQEYGGSLASIRSKGKVKPMDTLKKPRKENVSELCLGALSELKYNSYTLKAMFFS